MILIMEIIQKTHSILSGTNNFQRSLYYYLFFFSSYFKRGSQAQPFNLATDISEFIHNNSYSYCLYILKDPSYVSVNIRSVKFVVGYKEVKKTNNFKKIQGVSTKKKNIL